jgi:hypothetical protein
MDIEACMKAVGSGLQWDPRAIFVGHARQQVELAVQYQGDQRTLRVDSVDLSPYRLSAAIAYLV